MARDPDCVFCKSDFPGADHLVSDAPRYWLFVHDLNASSRFHSLIVLKAAVFDEVDHQPGLELEALPQAVLFEMGIVLSRASHAIRKSDAQVDRVIVASPDSSRNSPHPHFHLIPKRKNELLASIHEAVKDSLKSDVETLRRNFEWMTTEARK